MSLIKFADIKIGYNCNNNCIHCVIADQRERAKSLRGNENRSASEYVDEILSSKANGCDTIIITGGEPTIRPDFNNILKFAKSQGLRISLQTNGRLFSYFDFAKKNAPYIDSFTIAVHGHNAKIHDSIIRSKGGFDQVVQGIKNLNSLNKDIIAGKIVISTYNYKTLTDIIKLFRSIGVSRANLAFPHANGNARKYFDTVVPKYDDIRPYVEECIQYCLDTSFDLELEAILPCALNKEFPLNVFGDLHMMHTSTELKQLDSDNINDWTEVRKSIKRKGDICTSCIHNSNCEGYWMEYVEERGFSEFKPILEK